MHAFQRVWQLLRDLVHTLSTITSDTERDALFAHVSLLYKAVLKSISGADLGIQKTQKPLMVNNDDEEQRFLSPIVYLLKLLVTEALPMRDTAHPPWRALITLVTRKMAEYRLLHWRPPTLLLSRFSIVSFLMLFASHVTLGMKDATSAPLLSRLKPVSHTSSPLSSHSLTHAV